MKQQFKHDCERCKFIGQVDGEDIFLCFEDGASFPHSFFVRFADWTEDGRNWIHGHFAQAFKIDQMASPLGSWHKSLFDLASSAGFPIFTF